MIKISQVWQMGIIFAVNECIMRTSKHIQNLKCGGCASTIKSNLDKIDGLNAVIVDVEEGAVSFEYETEAQFELAHERLVALGYPFDDDKNSMITKAKSFVSCAVGRMSKESE